MRHWTFREEQLWQLAIFGIALAAALVLRQIALHAMRRRARDPQSFTAVSARTIGAASFLWSIAAALFIALRFADLTKRQAELTDQLIGASVIISVTLVVSAVIERMIAAWGERQQMPFAVAGLSRTLVRIVVMSLGLLWLLSSFDVRVTPLLTALGVSGIAVALALQDTLANFFAGVHILMERPLSVGDAIRLESGLEGTVTDIGWRTTRVRTGSNDMVVVPNTKITSGILVNYSLPEPRTVAEVAIFTGHEADPETVCRIAVEEALAVDGVLAEPPPVCVCDPGVLPAYTQFKLFVNVARRADQWSAQSAIRIRLINRFRAEGIPLPNPELARTRGVAP